MRHIILMAAALAAWPAAAQVPPHLRSPPPDHMRAFVRWSETIGAAIACGHRTAAWGERVRGRLHIAIAASHREGTDVEDAVALGAATEAYARQQARANRQEYCAFAASPADLAEADAVARADRDIPPVRPARQPLGPRT